MIPRKPSICNYAPGQYATIEFSFYQNEKKKRRNGFKNRTWSCRPARYRSRPNLYSPCLSKSVENKINRTGRHLISIFGHCSNVLGSRRCAFQGSKVVAVATYAATRSPGDTLF